MPLNSTIQQAALIMDWIPVLSFLWLSRSRQTRICRIIFIFIFTQALFRLATYFFWPEVTERNLWMWSMLGYEFLLMNYLYFHHSLLRWNFIILSGILFFGFMAIEMGTEIKFLSTRNVGNVIFVCYALRHIIHKVLRSPDRMDDYTFDVVNVGILFYFNINIILQFVFDQIHQPPIWMYSLQLLSLIIFKLILTFALWKLPSKSLSYPS